MFALHLFTLFCVGIPWISVVSVNACDTTIDGFTWVFNEDEDVKIPGSASADACFGECRQDSECTGFTWLLDEVVGNYCYKFKHIAQGKLTSCRDCTSGTRPTYIEGSCDINGMVGFPRAGTELECMKFCSDTPGCNFYTLCSSPIIPNWHMCSLYESCLIQSNGECTSGQIKCVAPVPNQCFDYKVLNEADRSIENTKCEDGVVEGCYADYLSLEIDCPIPTSLGWQGPGTYRVMEPAGLMIPEGPIDHNHCGIFFSYFLDGQHPEQIGAEVEMRACSHFTDTHNICRDITVTNCGDFYVYLLEENGCFGRYCATTSSN